MFPRILLAFLLVSAAPLFADPIPASSVDWTSAPFGGSAAVLHTTYCLMATGFFQAPTSGDIPALVAKWLKAHPKAMLIQVSSFGPVITRDPASKMIYVWMADGADNMNIDLVRQGAISPDTQVLLQIKEASQKLEAPKADYDAFLKKVSDAAKEARQKKLGIWSKPGMEEDAQ